MSRAVTISDVAREAGVSKTTAVFVLSERPDSRVPEVTQTRVRDAARKLGYRRSGPVRSAGRIHTVGLVTRMEPRRDPTLEVYPRDVLAATAHACREAGLRLTLISYPFDGTLNVDDVVDRRVDGLILVSLHDEGFTKQVYASGCPTVTIGSGFSPRRVGFDHRGGARLATQHLLELGHRRIAHVPGDSPESLAVSERQKGYEEAMEAAELTPRTLQQNDVATVLQEPAETRPTAFFAFNDRVAWLVGVHAREQGLNVPQDLSIVGFDNNVLAETAYPPLTTVENPLDAQAKSALEILQNLWRGDEPPPPTVIPAQLIVRQSTAPPLKETLL